MEEIAMLVKINPSVLNSVINRLYNDEFFGGFDAQTENIHTMRTKYSPAVNIKESENEYVIEMASPGFSKEDFQLNIEKEVIRITATVKETDEASEKLNYTLKEFSTEGFERTFKLPKNVDNDNVRANYRNGLLQIQIPKKAEVNVVKNIEIA